MQRCSNWDRQPKSRVGVDMWDTTSQCPGRDPDTRITNPVQQAQNTGSLSQLPIANRKRKDWFMEISRLTRSRSPWVHGVRLPPPWTWCPVAAVPHPAAVPDLKAGLRAADQVSPHGGIVVEVAPKCRTGGSLWSLPLTPELLWKLQREIFWCFTLSLKKIGLM